jgi:hypothetical protein
MATPSARVLRRLVPVLLLLAAGASAQTTDGFHASQVFPLVVDNASFAQRFTFRNPNPTPVTISATYYPANGVVPATTLFCPSFVVNAGADRTFTSLRALCPGLDTSTQFGMLYTVSVGTSPAAVYSAYSRVVNPLGNGFTVEGFAANEFTSATASVAGLRRLAAVPGVNPELQSNCFVGNLAELAPNGIAPTTTFTVTLYNSAGAKIGSTVAYDLAPGKIARLREVFEVVGAPPGDYDDARAEFFENGPEEPGMVAYCTVQDNTSFGADFRIAKQEVPDGSVGFGAQDGHAQRVTIVNEDVLGRPFELSIGSASSSNTHVMAFKHPDWVACRLLDAFGAEAAPTYGLEMRLVSANGLDVIAGGSGAVSFSRTYLGDKTDRNQGANTRYLIQVEANGSNTGSSRAYSLRCESGSGHSDGEVVAYKEAINRF